MQSSSETAAPATALEREVLYAAGDAGDELGELERLLADFGPSAEGFVARIERTTRPGLEADLCGYLGSVPFTSELFDDVRQSFGGGRFRARICDSDGKYKRSFTFTIAGVARRPRESDTAASVGVGPASAGESRLERMMVDLSASVASMAAAIQITQRQPAASSDDALERSLKLIAAVKEAMPTPTPATDSLSTLEAFFRIQDMLDERAPRGGESSSSIGNIVEHGVKPIAELMGRSLDLQERAMNKRDQQAAQQQRRVVSPVAPPAAAPTIEDNADVALEGVEQADVVDPVLLLAASIPAIARSYLAKQAKLDRDPETYAIMVLDTIQENNPDTYAELPALLEREDFTPTLIAAVPQWGSEADWFAQLVDCMRAQLADDAGDELETPAAGEAAA